MQTKTALLMLQFYLRRGSQISAMLESGGNSSDLFMEIVSQAMPIVKKYYPHLNADGLLDDVYTTLQQVLQADS
jgi:hypothetical protein